MAEQQPFFVRFFSIHREGTILKWESPGI